jgi:hypothetical protein
MTATRGPSFSLNHSGIGTFVPSPSLSLDSLATNPDIQLAVF